MLILPLLVVVAGCGTSKKADPPTDTSAPAELRPPKLPKPSFVRVFVFDGDLGTPVKGAVVHVLGRPGLTNRIGRARILLPHRGRLLVTVNKPGYDTYSQRLNFVNRPLHGVRVYQRKLQWTMYGATPQRTQAHPYIRVRPPFKTVWSRAAGALLEFPAVVDDGVAFVTNYKGSVRAYLMKNGATVWRRDIGGMMAASPAVYGDQLVVHGMDGSVWVLNRHNGRVLWRYTAGSPIESSPLVLNGVDYFGDWGGTVTALDLTTHKARWTYRSGNKITSSASYANGTVFIGDYGGRLLALAAGNGRLRWSGSVNGRIYGTPAVANGRVFASSSTGGSLTAFSTSGARLWSLGTGSYVYASPAVWNGRVYIGSYNGVYYCLSREDGRRALALLDGWRDRRRLDDRRRDRVLQQPAAPDLRRERADRQAGVPLRRRRVRARLRERATAPPARVLAALRGRAPAPMKMTLLVGGAALVLVAAGLVSYGLYRKHEGRDVRGSSTVEFVTTQAAKPKPKPVNKFVWPMYRFDPSREAAPEGIPATIRPAVPSALVLRRALAGRVSARRRVRPPLRREREGDDLRPEHRAPGSDVEAPHRPLHGRHARRSSRTPSTCPS